MILSQYFNTKILHIVIEMFLRGPLTNWVSSYLHTDFAETLILYVKRNSNSIYYALRIFF